MTEPTPADAAKAAEARAGAEARGARRRRVPAPGPLLGGEQRATGVVWAVRDGAVSIRPLAPHSVDVDPADVKPLSADDVDG
jgi:hypothetical protein